MERSGGGGIIGPAGHVLDVGLCPLPRGLPRYDRGRPGALASCLRDATGPAETLVAAFLPGVFTDRAPRALRDELSAIVSEFHPIGFRLMTLSSAETDTRELLPTIAVPTLLLWGEEDRRSPVRIAQQLHAAIPGAELAIIPHAGHLSNMEQPDAFNAHIGRFCLERDTAWTGGSTASSALELPQATGDKRRA